MVGGNKLNSVLEFAYLGSTISSNGCNDGEIQRRVAKVSASFGRLRLHDATSAFDHEDNLDGQNDKQGHT